MSFIHTLLSPTSSLNDPLGINAAILGTGSSSTPAVPALPAQPAQTAWTTGYGAPHFTNNNFGSFATAGMRQTLNAAHPGVMATGTVADPFKQPIVTQSGTPTTGHTTGPLLDFGPGGPSYTRDTGLPLAQNPAFAGDGAGSTGTRGFLKSGRAFDTSVRSFQPEDHGLREGAFLDRLRAATKARLAQTKNTAVTASALRVPSPIKATPKITAPSVTMPWKPRRSGIML